MTHIQNIVLAITCASSVTTLLLVLLLYARFVAQNAGL